MQSRAARAITRAVVAAGTAGAIATACWLLNRVLDSSELNCIEYLDVSGSDEDDEDDEHDSFDADDGFALLPVVSESDDENENDVVGYTDDYFTAPYDVCMLSVSVQTQVDPLQDVPPNCRLCRATSMDTAGHGFDLADKGRALSFSETDSSCDGSVLSIGSEFWDEEALQRPQMAEQWLYVRL